MFLCGNEITWADSNKYLSTDDGVTKIHFYTACNCLFANCRNQQELLQLQLLESYYLPILTLCTVAVKLSIVQTAKLKDFVFLYFF